MKVYLHIGHPKTGTSYLQKVLTNTRNRELLYRKYKTIATTRLFVSNIVEDFNRLGTSSTKEITEAIRSLLKRRKKAQTLIISNESFTNLKEQQIKSLAEAFRSHDVKIILYIRRQDLYCEAAWKQWGIKDLTIEQAYEQMTQNPLCYSYIIKRWEKYFGKESLVIRCYEKEQLPKGLAYDYFSIFNIPVTSLELPQKNINAGFDPIVLNIIRNSQELLSDANDTSLINLFLTYNVGQKEEFANYNLLNDNQRQHIINIHQADNQMIAHEYLNRVDGILFKEKLSHLPNKHHEYKKNLTVEEVIPVFMEILLKQHHIIKRHDALLNNRGFSLKNFLSSVYRRLFT